MITVDNSVTLLDKLSEMVDRAHLEDVKNIIQSLAKMNKLKYTIEKDLTEDILYETLISQIKKEFDVVIVQIIHRKEGLATELYIDSKLDDNCEIYSNEVTLHTSIDIAIQPNKCSEYQKIALNTYFKEVAYLLHMQFVLASFERSVMIDPLTKLQNRISFNNEMITLVPLAQREHMKFGVILLNIDRFRAVNDEHGNQFGDCFLKHYANIIKQNIRTSDIAVRFGGAEFLILLINVESEKKTIQIAHDIQDKLAATWVLSPNNDRFKKTVCIGIAMFPEDSKDINEVIKCSEIALSDAKDNGRNQLVRYQPHSVGEIEFF